MINRTTQAHSRVVTTELSPTCEQLRAAAIVSPNGYLTIMLVNRYDHDIQLELAIEDESAARSLRTFRYTPQTPDSAGESLTQESSITTLAAHGSVCIPLPAQSFALLTDIPADND